MENKNEDSVMNDSGSELDPGLQALANMANRMGEEGSELDYDEKGFDSDGIHKETGTKYDLKGYDKKGIDEHGVDREGYNRKGFNSAGYNREGQDVRELYDYDRYGFDPSGVHFFTGLKRDHHGFNAEGEYEELYTHRKSSVNPRGFDRDGYNHFTNGDLDWQGFNFDGINIETGQKYDKYGFDADGYYYDTTPRKDDWNKKFKTDRNGVDYRGFTENSDINTRTGTKYDKNGFDKEGYNGKGIDMRGYDRDGYNKDGVDEDGYGRDGYNALDLDREGYDRDGYKDGINRAGYNREGLDKDGNTQEYNARFNEFGVDEDGYMKNGELDPDVEFALIFAESGIKDQSKYAVEKGIDEKEVRERIKLARKKCPNVGKIIDDVLLTGNKMRMVAIAKDCDKLISGQLNADEFWSKHPKLTINEIVTHFIDDADKRKQLSDITIEGLVLDSRNIEKNLQIFSASQYDVSGALKGIDTFKRTYIKYGTDGSSEQVQKKRNNTKKIFDAIKYFSRYNNRSLDSLLGSRQSRDGGQTWIEFTGEAIGEAMDALKKDKKLICVQTVEDFILNKNNSLSEQQ